MAIDYFQLAVTMLTTLELTGSLDSTDYFTTAKCRNAIAKLQNVEVTTFCNLAIALRHLAVVG